MKNYNCDGSFCANPSGEVRVYPLGGGANLILCHTCWARENKFRYEKGAFYKRPQDWPQHDWAKAEVYSEE